MTEGNIEGVLLVYVPWSDELDLLLIIDAGFSILVFGRIGTEFFLYN